MKKISKIYSKILLILASISSIYAGESINIFNGKDLSNWDFALKDKSVNVEDVFFVKDGVINVKGTPLGYMFTKEKYKNFVLHVEWAYPLKMANSGIYVFLQDKDKNFWPASIQCQLLADHAGDLILVDGFEIDEYKTPKGEKRPDVPIISKLNKSNEKAIGEYNSADIICQDGKVRIYINGVLQNKATSKIKSGYVGLQSEGDPILFKNVKLIPLD